jgi:hypothetical protein
MWMLLQALTIKSTHWWEDRTIAYQGWNESPKNRRVGRSESRKSQGWGR